MKEMSCISSLKFWQICDIIGMLLLRRNAQPPPILLPIRSDLRMVNPFLVPICALLIFSNFHQVSEIKIMSRFCDSQRRVRLSSLDDRQDLALKATHERGLLRLGVKIFGRQLDCSTLTRFLPSGLVVRLGAFLDLFTSYLGFFIS